MNSSRVNSDAGGGIGETKLQYHQRRLSCLDLEFYPWEQNFREIAQMISPQAGRFIESDVNRGDNRYHHIYDETGVHNLRTATAGLMAGMTNPARPWIRLKTSDPGLNKFARTKIYLDECTKIILNIFAQSNVYPALQASYRELIAFGTSCTYLEKDFDDVIRAYTMTIGEYRLAQDERRAINTIYRTFSMTTASIVQKFTYSKCSQAIKNEYDRSNYDNWHPIVHAVEPRVQRNRNLRTKENMPIASVYFEKNCSEETDGLLSEGGFLTFPGLAPRWEVYGQDVYGEGCGAIARGSLRGMMFNHKIKAKAYNYQGDPPIQVPTSMRNKSTFLPGKVIYHDQQSAYDGVRTAYNVPLDSSGVLIDIQDKRELLSQTFFSDLFKAVLNSNRRQQTAREIEEKHEEKLLMLGPVLERMQSEKLQPLIQQAFNAALEADILPDPPPEMLDQDISVEYISMLSQAQKSIGIGAIDRVLGTIGALQPLWPEARHKIDPLKTIDLYAEALGVPQEILVSNPRVAMIQQDEQQQQNALQAAQMANETAGTAKALSETDTQGKNALTDVQQELAGV